MLYDSDEIADAFIQSFSTWSGADEADPIVSKRSKVIDHDEHCDRYLKSSVVEDRPERLDFEDFQKVRGID